MIDLMTKKEQYQHFLTSKILETKPSGFKVSKDEFNPIAFPHQAAMQMHLFTPPIPSFHNSVALKDKELIKANDRANGLQEKILKYFKDHPHNDGLTRAEVYIIFGQQYCEVSCGRALTNLADKKKYPNSGVYKTDEKRKGLYGNMPNSVYKRVK